MKQVSVIVGNARKRIEQKTRKKVVSSENYLQLPEKAKRRIKWLTL